MWINNNSKGSFAKCWKWSISDSIVKEIPTLFGHKEWDISLNPINTLMFEETQEGLVSTWHKYDCQAGAGAQ